MIKKIPKKFMFNSNYNTKTKEFDGNDLWIDFNSIQAIMPSYSDGIVCSVTLIVNGFQVYSNINSNEMFEELIDWINNGVSSDE